MDGWEKFNETSLPEKAEFYSNINMKDNINTDYMHAKTACKDFEIKHLSEYHDLLFKSDTLLLADVFETFRKMLEKTFRKIYELDPAKFLSASGIGWHTAFKKSELKIRIITWYWYAINGWKRH